MTKEVYEKEAKLYKELSNRFPYIIMWNRRLGSYQYYIEAQLEKADRLNAPGDTIYFDREDRPHTLREVKNLNVIKEFFPLTFEKDQ